MKMRNSAALLAVCLSAGSMLAAPAGEPQAGRVVIEQKAAATARPSVMRMPVTLAGSTNVAAVDESHDHLFVAQTDANGNIVIVCTDDHEAAAQISSDSVDTVLRLKPRMILKRANTAERE